MNTPLSLILACGLGAACLLTGCEEKKSQTDTNVTKSSGANDAGKAHDHGHDHDHDHDHEHGDAHDDHDHDHDAEHGHDHDHDEVPIGSTMVGDLKVECAQSHGTAAAGKELHLVVKLPYNDKGASTVRVWIGTEDRLSSVVAKADYAPSHDDYDVHALCPDPLPADAKWWIEVEKPDGTKQVGSIAMK